MKQIKTSNKLRLIFSALILCLTFSFAHQLMAKEYSREYSNEISVSNSDILLISMSGAKDAVIKTTDGSKASYKVKLILDFDKANDEIAKQIFELLNFEPIKDGNSIDIGFKPFKSTHIKGNTFSKKTTVTLRNGEKVTFSGYVSTKMIIEATIPKNNALVLNAGFSDIMLGHMANDVELKLRQTTLKANDVGELVADGSFSKIFLGNINGSSNINLRQTTLTSLNMNDVKAKLSFSTIETSNCGNIELSSLSQSTFKAEIVKEFTVNRSSFSTIDIDKADNVKIVHDGQGKIFIDILKDLEIGNASFSKIISQHCENVSFDRIAQTNFESETTKAITIGTASFSTFDIGATTNIDIERDGQGKYMVNHLNSFNLKGGSFTKIEIDELETAFDVVASQTNIKIENLKSTVNLFNVKNTFATISLGTKEINDFNFYLNDGNFTTVKASDGITKESDGYYTKRTTSKTPLKIKATCSNCTINLE